MQNPIPILLYHRVDGSGGPLATSPEVFAQHLAWLADQGYRSLTTEELDRSLGESGPAIDHPKPFMITFDDGYADLETTVVPLLQEYGFTATSFLITSLCPKAPSPDEDYLAWSTARTLATDGVLEFHSHTHSHERWSFDPEQIDVVSKDIDTSLAVLSDELGRPRSDFSHLAWPYGQTCPAWETAAERLGLGTNYVVQRGAPNQLGRRARLPRLMVDGYSLAALKVWMALLSTRPGALLANKVFGSVRQVRRGAGYL